MESMMVTPDSIQLIRDPIEGSISRKIKKGFIRYLHFPHEISLNRFKKYGVYCPNLDYEREKQLYRSSSSIRRMRFICSSKLNFPNLDASNSGHSVFNQFGYLDNCHKFRMSKMS